MHDPLNPSLPHSTSGSLARSDFGDPQIRPRSTVSWGAIFAGAVAALALQVLFMMLGAGLGLGIYSPLTEEDPVANLAMGALIIQSISAIVSLFMGGWVAGRFSPVFARATGWLHGFSVWCVATVGGVILVAMGIGWMLGAVASVGQSAASVAGGAVDLAAEAVEQSGDTITSFVDEAVSDLPEDATAREEIRATREVGLALARLFNPVRDGNTAANRDEAVDALVEHTRMSQAEAEQAVAEWIDTFEQLQDDLAALKEDAETTAREAADTAASALAKVSLWAFVGFLLGALAATGGGHLGAMCATKCEETTTDVAHSDRDKSDLPKRHPDA